MKDEPDFLGEISTEAPDVVSGKGRASWFPFWNGVERRAGAARNRRWHETMPLSALDARIEKMAQLAFLHTLIEETISFSATQYSVDEDQASVTITLIRQSPRPGLGVDVEVVTRPLTAVPGLHYLEAVTGPITFLAGQTTINRTVSILNANLGVGITKNFLVKISPPPSIGRYTLGSISQAVVTINGVGTMSQGGVLQFSEDSVSIREDAGTDSTTVQVTRSGGVAPGAASVVVTSTNGSAVAPTHYSAVNTTLNWASADSSPKAVPVSVVTDASAQGDRTFQLGLSAASGAVIGPVKAKTAVRILDVTAPVATGAYPLRAGCHIADPHDISSSSVLDKMMMEDFVVYGTQPTIAGGIPAYQSLVAALKARNPGIRVYLYWDVIGLKRNQGPFGDELLSYVRSQTGVPGLGVPPNQWIHQTSDGTQPLNPASGGYYALYIQGNAVPDSQGRRAFAYMMQYLKENILDVVPAADGLFADNLLHRPVDWTGNVVYQANNLNVSANDEPRRVSFRADQLAGINHFKTLTDKRVLGNIGGWVLSSTNVVPDMAALQLDGGMLENRFGTPIASFGLDVQGASVISNGNGDFATGMARANHALYASQNFRLRHPDMLFVCGGMSAADRAGAGRAAGYRYARYCMGTCWITTDDYLHLCDKTGGFSYSGSAGAISEYDEFFGADIAGLSTAQKFGFRKWMGLPLDPKQATPAQEGCYRRRWENCLAWVNPEGNGTKNIVIESAGAGKEWRLISGSQDQSRNTGAAVSGSYALQDQDCLFLRRVDA